MPRNDRSVRVLLAVVAVLLGANLFVEINHSSRANAAVVGGIPDSGAQFEAMVDSLKDLNTKVDKLDSFLESGALTVKMKDEKADKDK